MSDPALIEAVKSSNHEAVAALLDGGHDVHERGEQDWPALNFAAGRGDCEMVRLLIRRGADVFLTGTDRRTPYQIAVAASHLDAARELRAREEEVGGDRERISSRESETRPYCKAYQVAALRGHAPAAAVHTAAGDAGSSDPWDGLADDAIVFIHADYSVTRSFWPGEDVLVEGDAPEWRRFCQSVLQFQVPRELE